MIVKMTRYGFLLYHRDVEKFLLRLRELGLVDITLKHFTPTPDEAAMIEKSERYTRIIRAMKSVKAEGEPYNSVEEAIAAYEGATAKIAEMETAILRTKSEMEAARAWGEFDPKQIDALRAQGIVLRFYETSAKNYKTEWEDQYAIEVVSHTGSHVHFVVAATGDDITRPLDIVALELRAPASSVLQRESEIEDFITQQAAAQGVIARAALSLGALKDRVAEQTEVIDFAKVTGSGENYADGTLVFLEGWTPKTEQAKIVEFADSQELVYTVEDAKAEQNPPIKLKNNFFARAFEPIGDLYMLPRYDELDMTPFFAPFFMIFFGMCFGDAGYGLLLIAAVLVFWKKIPQNFRGFAWLIIFLNIAAVIFGIFTGNIFGIELAKIDALVQFKNIFLVPNDVFYFSIGIGAVQLLFGLILRTFNRIKKGGSFVYGLSNIGWLILLFSSIVAFGAPSLAGKGIGWVDAVIANYGTSSLAYQVTLYVALGLILFFSAPGKIFSSIGKGLYSFYEMATGLVGDLISYVRLFAIGLAGTIIAQVFNELSVGLSGDIPVVSFLVMLIILAIGHGLNLFISALGAVVHPIRLTFVEFYKNAEFEGGGRRFTPFMRRKTNNNQ